MADELRATNKVAIRSGPPPEAWYLIVTAAGAQQTIALDDPSEVLLGRAMLPYEGVSRRHATLRCCAGLVEIEDLGSLNGTLVNGERIAAPRRIAPGDTITLGSATAVLVTTLAPTPVATGGAVAPVIADPKMQQVMETAARVAASGITVLVTGESGVGKELVAEAIHRRSARAAGPFVRLNCAALSESLVESELFGHVRGAFTGAIADRPGHFELAAGGTLFLDEIGELSPATQAKMLRVLETRRVIRVGDVREVPVDARVVAATHRDLAADVACGRFREDLYFRIAGFVIRVPPLRERRAEIAPLARRFARDLSRGPAPDFAPAAIELLESYAWPGNVRELRNAIERALVLATGTITPEHLPDPIRGGEVAAPDIRSRMASIERQSVVDALAAADGNQRRAARALGISRFALMRLMDKHDLKKR